MIPLHLRIHSTHKDTHHFVSFNDAHSFPLEDEHHFALFQDVLSTQGRTPFRSS